MILNFFVIQHIYIRNVEIYIDLQITFKILNKNLENIHQPLEKIDS